MILISKLYWRLFHFIWTPIGLVAGLLWNAEWIPLGRFSPYVLGAIHCRWPQRYNGPWPPVAKAPKQERE